MERRAFLKAGGIAALAFGAGCASRRAPVRSAARPSIPLSPVDVAWDRVIRTTVGLRPHRPSGFLLKAEKLDAKTVVHNYGHGGAGMSVSWGTGSLAADLASATGERRAAVIGCGAVGLTATRQLQRRGFDVTIYAKTVPPDTTSNMSLAGFTPTSGLVDSNLRTDAWDAQFLQAADIAYRQLQLLVGAHYGVSWLYNYSPMEEVRSPGAPNPARPSLQAGLHPGQIVMQPGEHPFPAKYAARRPSLRIEPSIYLDAVLRDVLLFGGRVVIRSFDTPRDLMSLSEPVIVNCTGLGSRALFGDQDLVPLKGQLTVLVPQPEVDYATNGGARNLPATPGIGIHMMPRSDGIVLGGTSERGVWTLEPNENERRRVVEGHIQLFAGMQAPASRTVGRVVSDAATNSVAGRRLSDLAFRNPPTLESFFGLES